MTRKDEFLRGQVAQDFDFYRIREKISAYAISEEGKDLILSMESTSDTSRISMLKKLGQNWARYLSSSDAPPLSAWPPVRSYFKYLKIEGTQLMQDQIFALGLFCLYETKAKSIIESASQELDIPELRKTALQMPSLEIPAGQIFAVIREDGQLRDLPQIREIMQKISSLKKEIENALKKYLSDPSMNQALQSNVPAFRAERELLAVRNDHRNLVNGIIHEVSSSGSTVYIEPDEIVKANNELIEKEAELQRELAKIFRELTQSLSAFKDDFETALDKMTLLDATQAATLWGKSTGGIYAEDTKDDEAPKIIGARHPLLGEQAIPVTINFIEGKRVLIITGPNTGGKTVTLKTIALFSLLNQAGFPVPADEGTRLPVFSSIFADIGDEQSIDQSLSTFSSRMKNIAVAMKNADENSLILLDELGTGTDPQEGGAIAMAVLDLLLEKKSFVAATTHHGVLKNYGYTNPSCINASVEFDSETLKPTYRLLMGVPGESHAIDIALHSGLPPEAVEKARSYISTQQADVSSLINGLTKKHEELDLLIQKISADETMLRERELKIHQKEEKNLEKEIELKKLEHTQSSQFLKETRSKLENLVRMLREGEITREKTLAVKGFITELSKDVEDQTNVISAMEKESEEKKKAIEQEKEIIAANGMKISKASTSREGSSKKTKKRMSNSKALESATAMEYEKTQIQKKPQVLMKDMFVEGAEVLAGKEKRKGTLIRKEKEGLWLVQFGMLKMKVPQRELIISDIKKQIHDVPVFIGASQEDERPKFELRLLGMRYEEAIKALEHQIDLCCIHSFRNFSVIHGKGSGILQQGVMDYLSHCPAVKEFHYARPEEGGFGKTFVELI